jgi:hypothetical protein
VWVLVVIAMTVAGTRMTMATESRGARSGSENGRMACGDAPRPAVRLHLIDRAGLSIGTRIALMRETLAPWQATDASVAWVTGMPARPAGLGEPKDVYVFLEADATAMTDERFLPMASILFVDGQPTTHITVHAGLVARRLAESRLDDRPFAERPRLVRDLLLGRVLGRAIAHEVGHFLFGSREHAPSGLMRANHPIDRLMEPGHAMFRLVAPATPPCLVARTEAK